VDRIFDHIEKGIQLSRQTGECRRLFHGRGHCFEGLSFLTVDWFPPVLLVTFYKIPDAHWLALFRERIKSCGELVETVVFQYRYQQGAPNECVLGELPQKHYAYEHGLRYALSLDKNQNVGFFLDMANCRQWLASNVNGEKVLNLFSYTCAFSVVAIAANARSVVNVDMAKGALATGRLNHQINDLPLNNVHFFSHNIFKSWGKIRKYGPYQHIVVDPPSYQPGSFDARKDYQKIVNKLPLLMAPGALVLACLNSPELDVCFLRSLFLSSSHFEYVETIKPSDDFPESDIDKGLKTLVFKFTP